MCQALSWPTVYQALSSLLLPGPASENGHPRQREAEKGKTGPRSHSLPTHRNDGAPGIFTATLSSGHTFVLAEHKAMVAETPLLAAGGDAGAGDLTAVGARRQTGGKAVRELTVGWALQSYGADEEWLVETSRGGPKKLGLGDRLNYRGVWAHFHLLLFIQQTVSKLWCQATRRHVRRWRS